MLSQTLQALERDGVVHQKTYPIVPPKIEYSLTDFDRTLIDLLEGITAWSENNIEVVLKSQLEYDSRLEKG